jgi:hypothetical protein
MSLIPLPFPGFKFFAIGLSLDLSISTFRRRGPG